MRRETTAHRTGGQSVVWVFVGEYGLRAMEGAAGESGISECSGVRVDHQGWARYEKLSRRIARVKNSSQLLGASRRHFGSGPKARLYSAQVKECDSPDPIKTRTAPSVRSNRNLSCASLNCDRGNPTIAHKS